MPQQPPIALWILLVLGFFFISQQLSQTSFDFKLTQRPDMDILPWVEAPCWATQVWASPNSWILQGQSQNPEACQQRLRQQKECSIEWEENQRFRWKLQCPDLAGQFIAPRWDLPNPGHQRVGSPLRVKVH